MASDKIESNPVSLERNGIRIEKILDTNTFNQGLAIRLSIESVSNKTLDIRILDQLPDGFNITNVGFHPDYYRDHWDIHDDKFVVFNYVLEPGETVDTLYVTAEHETFELDEFRTKPQIVDTDSVDPTNASKQNPSDDESRSANADENNDSTDEQGNTAWFNDGSNDDAQTDKTDETDKSNSSDSPSSTDKDNETEDMEGNADSDKTTESSEDPLTSSDSKSTDEHNNSSSTDSSSVAAELRAEIEQGTVEDETLSVIAGAVEDSIETDHASETRLEHTEARVSELEAYTTALEDFLNDSGTATDLANQIQVLEQQFTELDDKIETLEQQLTELDDSIDRDTVETLDRNLTEMQEELDRLVAWRDAMTSAIDSE